MTCNYFVILCSTE